MDTLKKFNLEIRNARQMYTTAVLTMTAAGQHAVTVVPGKKGAGLPEFQAAVNGGQYAHVALLNVTNVMCVWHAEVPAIVEPVKQPVLDWKQPEPPKPNRLGVPNPLFHLDWEERDWQPEPGKHVRYLSAEVQHESTSTVIGNISISIVAYRYTRSFQLRMHIIESQGDSFDPTEDGILVVRSNRLLFKGTVSEFEASFDDQYILAQKAISALESAFIGGQYPEGDSAFDGWRNPPSRWGRAEEDYNNDDDDSAYGDGWDEFSSPYDMDI